MPISLVKSHQVEAADLRVHVREIGQGTPVLFVHGFPLDGTMWEQQLTGIPGIRGWAPDLPGFGQTPCRVSQLSMEGYAELLVTLLDQMKIHEPVVFVGLSMGGYIGWQFARKFPTRIRALVASNTRAIADPSELAAVRRANALRAEAEGTRFILDAMMDKMFSPWTVANNPQMVAEVRRMMERATVAGVTAALRGMADRPDATPWLSEWSVPTLVICGQDDVISGPTEMEGIARAIPGASFAVIPNAGHLAPLENPSAFNHEMQAFLQRIGT
jgi:pimeloyl-ACP methyl ester carboxylesterase